MVISGKLGLTKAQKKAMRLASLGTRKSEKKSQRANYHRNFQRKPGKRGYPRMKGWGR